MVLKKVMNLHLKILTFSITIIVCDSRDSHEFLLISCGSKISRISAKVNGASLNQLQILFNFIIINTFTCLIIDNYVYIVMSIYSHVLLLIFDTKFRLLEGFRL